MSNRKPTDVDGHEQAFRDAQRGIAACTWVDPTEYSKSECTRSVNEHLLPEEASVNYDSWPSKTIANTHSVDELLIAVSRNKRESLAPREFKFGCTHQEPTTT